MADFNDSVNDGESALNNANKIKISSKLESPLCLRAGNIYEIKVFQIESGECDTCGERGPAQYEEDEDNPDSPYPPLVYNAPAYLEKKRQKRPTVGMAQQLLNDFLIWIRLGGDYLTRGSIDKVKGYLDKLPELLKVDCWFGEDTENATKLFQEWSGNLKVDGKIGPSTWKELISFSDAFPLLYNRPYPEPNIPPENSDIMTVAGLGVIDNSPVMIASADPGFIPDTKEVGAPRCAKFYSKAKNFTELVQLVRDAEILLESSGVKDRNDRLRALRGIYYGTIWSSDYKKEKSIVRNTGFNIYASGAWGTISQPVDPRGALACKLFEALQSSQDAVDGARHVDFGHLIIGIEAREFGQTGNISMTGHSGLEAATWLGDLGGGAAMLANSRISAPSTRARTRFTGTDFGGSINLEGDIAAYVTGMNLSKTNSPSSPQFPSSVTPIGDILNDYLAPGTTGGTLWNDRSYHFLTMMGGTFSKKTLNNRTVVVDTIKSKIEEFGCYYLVNRLRQQGKLTTVTMQTASEYMSGAAQEVAEIFVDALQHNVNHPDQKLRAVTDPVPTGKGPVPSRCSAGILGTSVIEKGKEEIQKKLRDLYDILD